MIYSNFRIIITAYNAEKYVKQCLTSVIQQNYPSYKCFFIDDASTDSTLNLAKSCIKDSDQRFIFIRNNDNVKALANYVRYIPQLCSNDNDIIVSLDGDDYLYSSNVLSYLNEIYQNKNVWLTYGQYVCLSDLNSNKLTKGCSREIHNIDEVKKLGVNFSHLKTFKYFLWKKIKDEDLRRWDSMYTQRAWDISFMKPMTETAGLKRIKYIDHILYVYNNLNPISEWRLNEKEQLEEDKYIRNKSSYKECN